MYFTHDHADHTHGIDDLRMVHFAMRRRVDVYADAPTLETLGRGFAYCFATRDGSDYQPMLYAHEIGAGERVTGEG